MPKKTGSKKKELPLYEDDRVRMWPPEHYNGKPEEFEKQKKLEGTLSVDSKKEHIYQCVQLPLAKGYFVKAMSKKNTETGEITVLVKLVRPDGEAFAYGEKVKKNLAEYEAEIEKMKATFKPIMVGEAQVNDLSYLENLSVMKEAEKSIKEDKVNGN